MQITINQYKTNVEILRCLVDEAELSIEDITEIIGDITELMLVLHEKRKKLKRQN